MREALEAVDTAAEAKGGAGDDVLHGGAGSDRLIGGVGADVFQFFATSESSSATGVDWIDGFERAGIAGGDRINLAAVDANDLVAGDQAFVFHGTVAGGAGTMWLANSGTATMLYANTDADAAIELVIRVIDGAATAATYVAGDFVL